MSDKTQEILGVIYKRHEELLYGCILLCRHTPGTTSTPHAQSSPFVIEDEDREILGSVAYLLKDIRRSINDVSTRWDQFSKSIPRQDAQAVQKKVVSGKLILIGQIPRKDQKRYGQFIRAFSDILTLLSGRARNLFEMFGRLDEKITLFDYENKPYKEISLSVLFNSFVHCRYIRIDGDLVYDLFPAKPRPKDPISDRFMGFRFSWIEYVDAIEKAIGEVTVNDLIGLLRSRLRNLSIDTTPFADMVSLVQNIESFSRILSERVPDDRYQLILRTLFDDELIERLDRFARNVKEARCQILFRSPHVKLHENLSKRSFKISVQARFRIFSEDDAPIHVEKRFQEIAKEIGWDVFLNNISRTFGSSKLLDFIP